MQGSDEGVQGRRVQPEEASEVSDVVSVILIFLPVTAPSRLIFYEPVGKGGGIAAKSFDQISRFVGAAYDKIASCECDNGCNICKTLVQTHISQISDPETLVLRHFRSVLPRAQHRRF